LVNFFLSINSAVGNPLAAQAVLDAVVRSANVFPVFAKSVKESAPD